MGEDKCGASPDSKGKGKEAQAPSSSSAPEQRDRSSSAQAQHHSSADGSLAGRIAASAASLSRAAFSTQPGDLPSGSSGKQPATSSAPKLVQRGEAPTYRDAPPVSGSGVGPTFAQQRHSAVAEEARYDGFLGAQAGPDDLQPRTLPQRGVSLPNQPGAPSTVSQQEARDGLEVMNLLNKSGELEDLDDIDDGLQSFLLPQEEHSLREALFGNTVKGAGSNWAALLDFEPDFLRGNNAAQVQHYFGNVDSWRAGELWMDSWNEVLTSYTDEVWGDLGSLAREAQKEVEEVREQGQQQQGPGDMKALQRLRQILAHVRGAH